MNISLDFDNTYTRDPTFWNSFIQYSKHSGHMVYCVTARSVRQADEVISTIGQHVGEENCFFTDMKAKQDYMWSKHISIDVWIDDMPFFITTGVETKTDWK